MRKITLSLWTLSLLLLCTFLTATATPGALPLAMAGPAEAGVQAEEELDVSPAVVAPAAQVEEVTVAATTVIYTYDAIGRLVGVDYGNGRSIAYTYDAGGNLLTRTVVVGSRLFLPVVLK